MAVSKILHMKDGGGSFHGRHLKRAIDYITKPEKTQNKRLVSAVNCQADNAYNQMIATKKNYGKIDKRQGYHIVISFVGQETTPDTAFEITHKFTKEYLGDRYEAIFSVHDNTENIHSHIIFNSVSFVDGKKYHYKKGDWEKSINPIVNKLCYEYGLSLMDIDKQQETNIKIKNNNNYDNQFKVFSKMIKRDIDTCCIYATTFDEFLNLLKDNGYEVKQGKYLSIKPMGMKRFRRCKTLGEEYSEESILKKISEENLLKYANNYKSKSRSRLIKCYVKRYKKAKLTGLQKRYFRKLYKTGKLKKKSYSQVWKYKDDIRKMNLYQEQYLFLAKYNITNISELTEVIEKLDNKKEELSNYRKNIYKEISNFKSEFKVLEDMEKLITAENAYKNGDSFFYSEHLKWIELEERLKVLGSSFEKASELKNFYNEKIYFIKNKIKIVSKEKSIGEKIFIDIQQAKLKDKEVEKEIKVEEKKNNKKL